MKRVPRSLVSGGGAVVDSVAAVVVDAVPGGKRDRW